MLRFCPHCAGKLDDPKILEWGGWAFDEINGSLMPGSIHLTTNHKLVVGSILRGEGSAISRDKIYSALTHNKPDADWPELKIVDVYVSKIRKMMKQERLELIGTNWGAGYYAIPYSPNPTFDHGPLHLGKGLRPSSRRGLHCKCGHAKSDHARQRNHSTGNEGNTYCLAEGCNCERYKYNMEHSAYAR